MLQLTILSNGSGPLSSSRWSRSSSALNGIAPRTAYCASWTALLMLAEFMTRKLGSRMVQAEEVKRDERGQRQRREVRGRVLLVVEKGREEQRAMRSLSQAGGRRRESFTAGPLDFPRQP